VRTFERLRRGLGLDASAHILLRAPEPAKPLDVHLARLAACLWACGGRVQLVDLATALGIATTAVREQLPLVTSRLAACGIGLVTDGVEVRLELVHAAVPAVHALHGITAQRQRLAVGEEALPILAYLGWHGEASRADLESLRGENCETLLGRLVNAGLLDAVRDSTGNRPNRYRLTPEALQVFEVASLEELRERMTPMVGDDALAKLQWVLPAPESDVAPASDV
jgi:chromosome segregation and condensation protein ScpB